MAYTQDEINNWPDDTPLGLERELADQLTTETIEYAGELLVGYDGEARRERGHTLFQLLLMHEPAFTAMVWNPEEAKEIRQKILDDPQDESGEGFVARLEQRVRAYEALLRWRLKNAEFIGGSTQG